MTTDSTTPTAVEATAALTRRFVERFAARDLRAVRLLSDDVTLTDPLIGETRGKAAARHALAEMFIGIDAIEIDIVRQVGGPTCSVCELHARILDFVGSTIEIQAVALFEITDGRIDSVRTYVNDLAPSTLS